MNTNDNPKAASWQAWTTPIHAGDLTEAILEGVL